MLCIHGDVTHQVPYQVGFLQLVEPFFRQLMSTRDMSNKITAVVDVKENASSHRVAS